MNEITYSKVGIDINKHKEIVSKIWKLIVSTWKKSEFCKPIDVKGHYAGIIDVGLKNSYLAMHVDGVGTKMIIARLMNDFRTVGLDCVGMCANDLICVGARPIAMIDYIGGRELNSKVVQDIISGLVKGCEIAEMALVGGETATMPDVLNEYDLVGMVVGVVDRSKIITGEKMKVGDVVIGLESSGLHSNGYTLARKVLFSKYKVHDFVEELGKTMGEELLIPTKIYVKPVLEIIKNCEVHGLANITGGAFSKLMRVGERAGVGFLLDTMPELPKIFKLIQEKGNISDRELYRTFNCGIGFCVVVPEDETKKVVNISERYGIRAKRIGKVVKEKDVKIKTSTGVISILI
ncbi:MAG: phosphoribosylformylglycinamidine cyclo-ligase [Candidatus Aenigmarchaeota archaeon]|nr:phosphoribosylformylglycinamidine cyclo-ligase [Candidatus Aenigmarchaeota archaeon]